MSEQTRLNQAILKTSVRTLAETRSLRDMLLVIHNQGIPEGVQILMQTYMRQADTHEKLIYENIYAEMGALPKDVEDVLDEMKDLRL